MNPLSASELTPFDQLHYHGTESVDLAVERAKISTDSSVLEIGSGLGGPARHIAATAGARVTALELQRDQNALASKTNRALRSFGKGKAYLRRLFDIRRVWVAVRCNCKLACALSYSRA